MNTASAKKTSRVPIRTISAMEGRTLEVVSCIPVTPEKLLIVAKKREPTYRDRLIRGFRIPYGLAVSISETDSTSTKGCSRAAAIDAPTRTTGTGCAAHPMHKLKTNGFGQTRQHRNLGLKRKPTQRGGGCCVGVPVKQRSGWTSL